MAAKKLNLAPDVKSRLRQAVLGGISPADGKSGAAAKAPKSRVSPTLLQPAKPQAKMLKKIIIGAAPVKAAPTVSKPSVAASAVKLIADKPAKTLMITNKNKALALSPKIEKKQLLADKSPIKKSKPLKSKRPKTKAPRASDATSFNSPFMPPEVKSGRLTPPFAVPPQKIKPSGYKPFATAKRDWEKPEKQESLEKLFQKSGRSVSGGKADFFDRPKPGLFKQSGKFLGLKLVGLLVLIIVMFSAFLALGIYKYGFNDAFSSQVARSLDLPAGYVGASKIRVSDYIENIRLLAQPLAMNREGLIDYSGKSDLSDRIFYRLAANQLVTEKLASYNKSVTVQDVDNQVALLLKQTGGQAQADKIIEAQYGLNFSQFKDLVLLPMMQRSNLQAAIISDDSLPLIQEAKARAETVLQLAQASTTDFNALAKQYTDDESGVNTGGDLGWIVKGQLDQSWESLIFTAATGTVISQPIKSGFGFHIVKVEQKLVDKATGAVSVKLRHILIKVDVDQYIRDLLASASLVKYIN